MILTKKSSYMYLAIFIAIFLIDITSKIWIKEYLENEKLSYIAILPFLNIVSVWNKGISFGILNNANLSAWFLLILNIIVVTIIYWAIKKWSKFTFSNKIAFAIILAGACGNNFDRFYHGAVFDFIDFYYDKYHWPAFNIADIAVTMGAIILIFSPVKND